MYTTAEPELMRPPSGSLERSWLRMQPPRQAKKACKRFWCPNPPNRGTATRREEGRILQGKTCVCRAMQKQGSIVHSLRELANCSKLRKASVGWAEFKPHLRGSLEPSPKQRTASRCTTEGHGVQLLTQHRHAGLSAKCNRGVSTRCLNPMAVDH